MPEAVAAIPVEVGKAVGTDTGLAEPVAEAGPNRICHRIARSHQVVDRTTCIISSSQLLGSLEARAIMVLYLLP